MGEGALWNPKRPRAAVTCAGPRGRDENAEAASAPRLPGSLQPSISQGSLQQLVGVAAGGRPKGGGRGNGGTEASKATVRFHTLWQPAPPGTVRPIFLCRRFACLTPCEQHFPALAKRFLEIFSQGQFPRRCGGPRGPNSQGKEKPHGQVYAL